jgi:hypothetical protein
MVELEQHGNWFSIWMEYDGFGTLHKANGKQQLNDLLNDLIHDVKIDNQFHLVSILESYKK